MRSDRGADTRTNNADFGANASPYVYTNSSDPGPNSSSNGRADSRADPSADLRCDEFLFDSQNVELTN